MPTIAMTQEMGSLSKDVALQFTQTMNLAVSRHEMAATWLEKCAFQPVS